MKLLRVSAGLTLDRPVEGQARASETFVDEVGPEWDVSQASAEGAGEAVGILEGDVRCRAAPQE
ncbi:hypothetical protein [Streptomyces sp. NPDC090036]|uniref:hypothetical protein n=1 Tax=Streptomyces sp. NPDC090036 TaxID=3365926 RepID=UPI0038021328